MSAETCATCGEIEVRYYRSADGAVVHRESCSRRGKGSVPWHYATCALGAVHERVLAEIDSLPWLRGCSYCMGGE